MPIRISRRQMCAMLGVYPAARLLRGQQPSFSTEVKVVNVLATVRAKDGHIVKDLNKEDFALTEDGRPQTIRYFSRETNLPLTLGLLVDTSMSQRRVLGQERTASFKFLEQVLREDKDRAFIIHFDREVELLQDLTSSRQKLEKSLDELEVSQPSQQQQRGSGGGYPGGGRRGGGGGGGHHGGGTSLYDAVLLASNELMKKQQGRKALIVLSDGVDNASKVPIADAIEAAQRSDSLLYSILFADEDAYRGGNGGYGGGGMGRRGGMGRYPQQERPDGKKVLQRLSKETGGGFFEVSKKEPVDKIYERIEEELRNQYSLGYTPDQANSEAAYRRITVTANQKGMTVQAREGYYPS